MTGFRKVFLAVLFTVIGLAVELTHKNGLTGGLVELLLGLYGAFAIGNISEHWADSKKKKFELPPGSIVPLEMAPPPLDTELHNKADELLRTSQVSQQALEFLVDYLKRADAAQKGS